MSRVTRRRRLSRSPPPPSRSRRRSRPPARRYLTSSPHPLASFVLYVGWFVLARELGQSIRDLREIVFFFLPTAGFGGRGGGGNPPEAPEGQRRVLRQNAGRKNEGEEEEVRF